MANCSSCRRTLRGPHEVRWIQPLRLSAAKTLMYPREATRKEEPLPSFLPESLPSLDQLGWFALLLVIAVVLGELARLLRLPRILGYVAAGIAVGPHGGGLMHWATVYDLRILVDAALGLLLFELGHAIDLTWLRRNPWLLATSVLEAGLTFGAIFGALHWVGVNNINAVGASAIGMSTSPAVVVQLTRELRAQGQVTERLKMLTALNSAYAVVAMAVWLSWLHLEYAARPVVAILHPIYLIAGAMALSAVATLIARILPRWLRGQRGSASLLIFGLVLLVIAGARALELSPLLTLLSFGLLCRRYVGWLLVLPADLSAVASLTSVILFALIGASLSPVSLEMVALATAALVCARLAAKWVATVAMAAPSGITTRKGALLGLGLTPASGMAMLLAQDVTGIYPGFPSNMSMIVGASIVVLEIIGPVLTKVALTGARETRPD
jgi:Kef-type K+ transport system membrane component KefB